MNLYDTTSYDISRLLTERYSTSFSLSIRLFSPDVRPHIYAIYGLVRIADEIVDTYKGPDADTLLAELEHDVFRAIKTGYSSNPIVQSFSKTAREFSIGKSLIGPFFKSMKMDLAPQTYTKKKYASYIDGSAEVIGLMCLKIFVDNGDMYVALEPAARRLGAAYQKINFLRDIAADHELGRWYFPEGSYDSFNEPQKRVILQDIQKDFDAAESAFSELPLSCRKAITLSKQYYQALHDKIALTPAKELKNRRVRISNMMKLGLLSKVQWGRAS